MRGIAGITLALSLCLSSQVQQNSKVPLAGISSNMYKLLEQKAIVEQIEVDSVSDTLEEAEQEVSVDDAELEILARVINGEAGSSWCSTKLQYYVGSVVLNRVDSMYYPNTIREVVFQHGQYACTWDGNYNRSVPDEIYDIAKELLINGSLLPSNVVYQAQFRQGDGTYIIEQNMYFCYRN